MTDPTADAAKLLPCPYPWRGDDGSIQQCVERDHCGCDENTRPQPAPAGEPDFNFEVEYLYRHGDHHGIRRALREAYRLGFAARPKVEDGEVAELCGRLRGFSVMPQNVGEDDNMRGIWPSHTLEQTADLLERLAGELTEITAARDGWKQQHENLVGVRETDIANLAAKIDALKVELNRRKGDPRTRLHNLCEALQEDLDKSPYTREEWERVDRETVELQRQLRESKAKLAERDVELAMAQKLICYENMSLAEQECDDDDWEDPTTQLSDDEIDEIIATAREQHAARQQHRASAEPTEREGE